MSAAVCAHAAALGFSNRHYMTLIPMDCTAASDVEEEARTYGELREQILFEVLDRDRVNIKIIYAHSADAYRAYMAMQGRCFDGKTIKATLT